MINSQVSSKTQASYDPIMISGSVLAVPMAYGCGLGFSKLAEKVEEAVVDKINERVKVIDEPGLQLIIPLAHYVSEKTVREVIDLSKLSGKSSVTLVAIAETLRQVYKLSTEYQESWALNILSGQYQGAALGVVAGPIYSQHRNQKEIFAAAAYGALFGTILGGSIAGLGSAAQEGKSKVHALKKPKKRQSTESSPSPIRERPTDIGLGLGELIATGILAGGCHTGVSSLAKSIERFVIGVLQEEIIFRNPPGLEISLSLSNYISEQAAKKTIDVCKESGKKAGALVAAVETFTQLSRLYHNNQGSWSIDIVSGQYRGAALGATAGLFESRSANSTNQLSAIAIGSLFGSILGGAIAGVGCAARKTSATFQSNNPDEHALQSISKLFSDVFGLRQVLLSSFTSLSCRYGAYILSENIEKFALDELSEGRTFHHFPKLEFHLSLNHLLTEKATRDGIGFCKDSGKSAATLVAAVETLTQLYRVKNKDQGHFASDILSGSYRGAGFGASAGLFNSFSGSYGDKCAAVAVGTLFGFVIGGSIAAMGSAARQISPSLLINFPDNQTGEK